MTTTEMFEFDKAYGSTVAGVDEAGRGPLAGPVVAACCAPCGIFIDGINDSKKLSEKKREELFDKITDSGMIYAVSVVDEKTIDAINILNATKKAMENCVKTLTIMPDIVLIDAVKGLNLPFRQLALIKADAKSYSVAAASIIAKVTRDRLMRAYDAEYPLYGFNKHKGYGTAAHIAAIKKFGPCEIHRRTFIGNFIDE